MRNIFILLALSIFCNSCLKSEYEDYTLPHNQYGDMYPDIKTVTFIGFRTQGIGQSCNLYLDFKIDTTGTGVHPGNIGGVFLFQNNKHIRTLQIWRTNTVLARSCLGAKTFRFQLIDKEGYHVGKATTVVWE